MTSGPTYEMPVFTPVQMVQASLGTTPAVVYVVPTAQIAMVQRIVIANTTLTWIDVYLNFVPTATVGDTSNAILFDVPIPPEGSIVFDMMQITKGCIAAWAESAGLVLTVSGETFPDELGQGTWDLMGMPWDSVPNTVTWDDMVASPGYAWDGFPVGTTWDSIPAGKTWDNYA